MTNVVRYTFYWIGIAIVVTFIMSIAAVIVMVLGYLISILWNAVLVPQGLKPIDLFDGAGLYLLKVIFTGVGFSKDSTTTSIFDKLNIK